MKRTTAMFVSAIATLTLAGCGGDSEGVSGKAEESGPAIDTPAEDVFGTVGGSGPTIDASTEDAFKESFDRAVGWMEGEHGSKKASKLGELMIHAYYRKEGGKEEIDGLRATEALSTSPDFWEEKMQHQREAREKRQALIDEHNQRVRQQREERKESAEHGNAGPAQ